MWLCLNVLYMLPVLRDYFFTFYFGGRGDVNTQNIPLIMALSSSRSATGPDKIPLSLSLWRGANTFGKQVTVCHMPEFLMVANALSIVSALIPLVASW